MTNIPEPIKKLGEQAVGKAADKFADFVITKLTGKSIKVFQAEGDVEADKVKSKWGLEKPFWLQVEKVKINRQYSNLGNTLMKAAPLIEHPENEIIEDDDVFWGLLEHSKEISNEQMQQLIAKIIAGEYNSPGTYSMSTLQTLKMLGKSELELFEKICSLLINNDQIPQIIFSFNGEEVKSLMRDLGVDFGSLQTLQSLGLFLPNDMTTSINNPEKKNFRITYFDKSIVFKPASDGSIEIVTPEHYGLSDVGKQILKHLSPKFNDKFFQWLRKNYKVSNFNIEETELVAS